MPSPSSHLQNEELYLQTRLEFIQAVQEQYPDAVLINEKWCSRSLLVEDCDAFYISLEETQQDVFPVVKVHLCKKICGNYLYLHSWGYFHYESSSFHSMQEKNPELYQQLLEYFKQQLKG
jgi:hypothetical protein